MYSEILGVDYDLLKPVLQSGGLFNREDMHTESRFAQFGYMDPYYRVGHTYEYVFFTKPDLYIKKVIPATKDERSYLERVYDAIFGNDQDPNSPLFGSGTNLPIFSMAHENWDYTLQDLQYSRNTAMPLSSILYNHRRSNLDLPDLQAEEIETGENMWGNKIYYRRSSITSADDFEFTMEFEDNKFLDCYMFFRLYEVYEDRKAQGMINLYEDSHFRNYIYNKRIHDQMSVYKFIVGEDGRELIHWSKLYGVYPKGCPRSVFGDMPEDGNFKFSVTFKANFVEDLDPNILGDFNRLSASYRALDGTGIPKLPSIEKPVYDVDQGFVTNSFKYPPYFHWEESNRRNKYKIVMLWGDD